MKQVKIVNKKTDEFKIIKYDFPFERLVANLKNCADANSRDPMHKWIGNQEWNDLKFVHLTDVDIMELAKKKLIKLGKPERIIKKKDN